MGTGVMMAGKWQEMMAYLIWRLNSRIDSEHQIFVFVLDGLSTNLGMAFKPVTHGDMDS